MNTSPVAILFDIDGTLITSAGAGAESWRLAFLDLYGLPADIGHFSDAGMTDPEVGRRTFAALLEREPTGRELTALLCRRLDHLRRTVPESAGYRVLDGVSELLPRLADAGCLLGLTTGGTEAAAHIKLARAELNHFFLFGGFGSDSPDRTELTRCAIARAGTILGAPVDPAHCLVIGDTPSDVAAAHGAGAVAVAVASGKFGEDELRAAGADHVMASLREPFPSPPHVSAEMGASDAFDWPGIPPAWTSSAKDAVTTALGLSRVWATVGFRIINEVYRPATGRPQVRPRFNRRGGLRERAQRDRGARTVSRCRNVPA